MQFQGHRCFVRGKIVLEPDILLEVVQCLAVIVQLPLREVSASGGDGATSRYFH